jgi:hypothetical protein
MWGEKAGGFRVKGTILVIAGMIRVIPQRQPQVIERMLPDQSGHLRFRSVLTKALHRLK